MLLGSDISSFIFCTTGIFGPSPTFVQNLKMPGVLKVLKRLS